ncbi:MAG: hypothetical protein ACJAZM_000927 [Cyclobacteriaceae bacterium]|jgi:hypothetical protein
MKNCFFLVFAFFSYTYAHGQIYEDYEYKKEYLWGVNKNTNGGLIGGVFLRHSRSLGDGLFTTYGIELMNVKHPKEQRYTSTQTGSPFVWGKSNYLFTIRGQYGREKLLFRKASQQGVQISAGVAGGLSIGLEAPYLITTQGAANYVQFDPDLYPNIGAIQGSGQVLQSIGNSSIVPGLNSKAYISFEFGAFRNNVAGVELGASAEAFVREIVLIPTLENRAFFPAFFFTFFWGTRR